MNELIYRRDTCRLCGSRNLELVLKLKPSPIGDAYVPAEKLHIVQKSYPVDLFLCDECGHAQLIDVIDPKILYTDYIYLTSSSLGLVEHFKKYAEEALNEINPPKGALVVDIGSNDGSLLSFFKMKGMRVLGIDPARQIALDTIKIGIETLPEFFTLELAKKIKKERGSAMIVTANNVLSNVDDLNSLILAIRGLLDSRGVIICEVFYLADLIQNMVFDYIYHEHLDYHSVKPLNNFFKLNGLELINIKPIPTKCGSLRCTVQFANGPRMISESVKKQIAFEENFGLHSKKAFREFNDKITNAKNELVGFLRKIKSEGKTVVAYGASVTCTALINHFELDEFFDFLVDDNQQRQGLYSPGLHLPVLSPQAIYDKKVDCVVILAWRYAEPIINKNKKFLEIGGHFIVPLPKIRVI